MTSKNAFFSVKDVTDYADFIPMGLALPKLDSQTVKSFEENVVNDKNKSPSFANLVSVIKYQLKVLERSRKSSPGEMNSNSSGIKQKQPVFFS